MSPNPFSGLVHSRKFWLAVVSAIAAILGLWVAAYCTPTMQALIMGSWVAFSGVLVVVIMSIASEDNAKATAAGKVEEAKVYAAASGPEVVSLADEALAEATEAAGLLPLELPSTK